MIRTKQPIAAPGILELAKGLGKIDEYGHAPEDNVFRVVYPMINDQAFAIMMDNYRRHVDDYNMRTEWENVDIHNYNQNVEIYLRSEKATDIQKVFAAKFPELNKELIRSRDYNAAARKANDQYGPIVKLRPHHIIKPVTEQFFQNFLHVYNTQLERHNDPYIKMSNRTPRALPALKINSHFITQLRRADGAFSLKVCAKTVRTHRQHLEAAGVFVESNFRGRQMAVELRINPEILAIYDDHTRKLTRPENQPVPTETRKTLPDTNETTGTFKEEYKEKNGPTEPFVDKVSAEPTAFGYKGSFTRTQEATYKSSPGGAPTEVLNPRQIFTQKYRKQIMHPQELAEALARGDFNDYTPIPIGDMIKLAYEGLLNADEYRELYIQDFFKQSAKIYIGRTPYPGVWKKAINLWMKYKFLNFKGNPMSPTNIADYIPEYRWRLEQARRWFLRSNVKVGPLYPSDYFDPTRKQTNEIGFEGTAKMWQRKKAYEEKQPVDKVKLEKKSALRKKRLSNTASFNREIDRYLKGRTTLSKLYDHVAKNLPADFLDELPKALRKQQAAAAQSNFSTS